MQTAWLESILKKHASIQILGAGYVGLPLALRFAEQGFRTRIVDTSTTKVDWLRAGHSYVSTVPSERVAAAINGNLTPDHRTAVADAHIICVPTPVSAHKEPDLSCVVAAAQAVAGELCSGNIVILESTTYPGTTRDLVRPILESISGLHAGDDFLLAYSPEREDPGNKQFGTSNTPKIVGGYDVPSGEVATMLYRVVTEAGVHLTPTMEEAEMAKLFENSFRSVNIALVNELKVLCQATDGIDVWNVLAAAATKPFGFMRFTPGPGIGGHCIPIDPLYLSWKAKEHGVETRMIDTAASINDAMPAYVVRRVVDALNSQGKALKGATVCVVGVAYKADVGDCRESPARPIIDGLAAMGANVCYMDPYVPTYTVAGRQQLSMHDSLGWRADCAVVVTRHSEFPHAQLLAHATVVVDTRDSIDPSRPGVFQA